MYKSQYKTGILNKRRAKGKGFDLIRGGEGGRNIFLHQASDKFLHRAFLGFNNSLKSCEDLQQMSTKGHQPFEEQ